MIQHLYSIPMYFWTKKGKKNVRIEVMNISEKSFRCKSEQQVETNNFRVKIKTKKNT